MSAFTVMNQDFGPTWKQIVPFLNSGKRVENVDMWWREDQKALKLLETAQKAIYIFICKLCN